MLRVFRLGRTTIMQNLSPRFSRQFSAPVTVIKDDNVVQEEFSPTWNKSQVKSWLDHIRKKDSLKFNPDEVAFPGATFRNYTKKDFCEMINDRTAAIVIWTAIKNAQDEVKNAQDEEKRRFRSESKEFTLTLPTSDGEIVRKSQTITRSNSEKFFRYVKAIQSIHLVNEGLITTFEQIEANHHYEIADIPNDKDSRRIKNLEEYRDNRVLADEDAMTQKLLTVVSGHGFFEAPAARNLCKWSNSEKHQDFADLVRKGLLLTSEDAKTLKALQHLFELRDQQVMEFDGVLLNCKVAIVAESKSTLSVGDLNNFTEKVKKIRTDENNGVFRIFHGMEIVPVCAVQRYLGDKQTIKDEAAKHSIILMSRDGSEFGLDEDMIEKITQQISRRDSVVDST